MDLEAKLEEIESQVKELLTSAQKPEDLLEIRKKYLSRQGGELTVLMRELSQLSPELRPSVGRKANQIKQLLENQVDEAVRRLETSRQAHKQDSGGQDISLPGIWNPPGSIHPLTQTMDQILGILEHLGFQLAEGPEIETDYYNFEALNFPPGHPAREMHDTFFIAEKILLRTQTSPVQIRVMEKIGPPLRVYAPGKVYRRDLDVSHTPMFHQVEGLWVDRDISFGHLKGVLMLFAEELFGQGIPVRFRPSFFPFTEPSAEVDIGCQICQGKGCRVCDGSGWMEILGAGMVHPELFRRVGYDPDKYSGFAFGLGVERVAMLKFGINDIRLFFENDLRFLSQF